MLGLLLTGLLGLCGSVCGGAFTAASVVALLFSHDPGARSIAITLPIAVPSLAAGLALLWATGRRFRKLRRGTGED